MSFLIPSPPPGWEITMHPDTLDLIGKAVLNGYQVDLGQFDKAQLRELQRGVRRGELLKARLCWPWLHSGTCVKTFYINAAAGA